VLDHAKARGWRNGEPPLSHPSIPESPDCPPTMPAPPVGASSHRG
jgi:hypothetical protein